MHVGMSVGGLAVYGRLQQLGMLVHYACQQHQAVAEVLPCMRTWGRVGALHVAVALHC